MLSRLVAETSALLRLHRNGDVKARCRLIDRANLRCRHLAEKMLQGFPGVQLWEDPDDVAQRALMRLDASLRDFSPSSSDHFWNLTAVQIRRTLLDLARKFQGPQGLGANQHPPGQFSTLGQGEQANQLHPVSNTLSPEGWAKYHEAVDALPPDIRTAFERVYYCGCTHEEVARELKLSVSRVIELCKAAEEAIRSRM